MRVSSNRGVEYCNFRFTMTAELLFWKGITVFAKFNWYITKIYISLIIPVIGLKVAPCTPNVKVCTKKSFLGSLWFYWLFSLKCQQFCVPMLESTRHPLHSMNHYFVNRKISVCRVFLRCLKRDSFENNYEFLNQMLSVPKYTNPIYFQVLWNRKYTFKFWPLVTRQTKQWLWRTHRKSVPAHLKVSFECEVVIHWYIIVDKNQAICG